MTCQRFVYERMAVYNFRTLPSIMTMKPVRYRDQHDDTCEGNCAPVEMPWPEGEEWPGTWAFPKPRLSSEMTVPHDRDKASTASLPPPLVE